MADCWNRAFPTPPCHQATVIVVFVLYQNNIARIKNPDDFILDLGDFVLDLRFSENPIITTLKYFGPKVNLILNKLLLGDFTFLTAADAANFITDNSHNLIINLIPKFKIARGGARF